MRKSLPVLVAFLILSLSTAAMAVDASPAVAAGIVNINTADIAQLSMLPRVGLKAAQRIVDYRTEHGPFKKSADLMQVKGFGQKSFERLSGYITVEGKSTLASKVRSPRGSRGSKRASKSHETPTTAAR
ncbi:MAG: helix-hairpin-helix domain-containing protein [Thermoanaerobaculia bacterium]